ncbi:hypothetical protein [Candidatus Soleaferrea massiliensis]|uniref:hypothetical protein n=1 Tax=Candidatus Soleaferrea massiliensis TaxID=1470354 RepID=UPI0005913064|nr:hypothetical protein [Candidatus Soleaferrea massiliensis]
MKKLLLLLLSVNIILLSFIGCSDDKFTDQPSYIPPGLPEGAMVDDSDFSGDYDINALAAGDVQIAGRTHGLFDITTSLFVKRYNDLNPSYKIKETVESEKWSNEPKLFQCKTDGNYTIYILSNIEVYCIYFSYPVAETRNGAWDYEEDIDKMLSVFDTAMPDLYDENNKLSLKYLSKWMDVGSKEQNLDPMYLEILRKYMNATFQIRDGIAYVAAGVTWFEVQDNWNSYF